MGFVGARSKASGRVWEGVSESGLVVGGAYSKAFLCVVLQFRANIRYLAFFSVWNGLAVSMAKLRS